MAIDPNTLEWGYRTFVGSDSEDQKANYSFNFNSGGKEYTFIPRSVVEKGVDTGDNNYVFPAFLNQDNITKLGETSQYVDLNGVSWYGDYLKDNVGASTDGFLVPSGSFDFGQVKIVPNNVRGVGTTSEGLSYILETPAGKLGQYVASDGKVTTLTQTGGSSLLGDVFGGWVDDFTTSTGIVDIAGGVNDFFKTDIGKAVLLASAVAGSGAFGGEGEVGSVYGPDNIDIGGGFNPAAVAAPAVAPTAQSITSDIATQQVAQQTAEQEAARIAAENAAYDQAMQDLAKNYVSPEFATSAAAQGLTFKQGLDAVRAGLLINAVTGDPLGLSDVGGSAGNNFAESGFAQVPIPEDWKSPTYTYSPVQNVTFEDLFPGVSLQGTQWQNMPQAQTFNEMFASGQQQTPMGSPVDINQIVGSILGQSATS